MSDNGGEILSTQRLEEQLNREEAIDDDDDVFSTGIPAQQDTGTSDYSVSPEAAKENQNLLNLLYLIAEVSLAPRFCVVHTDETITYRIKQSERVTFIGVLAATHAQYNQSEALDIAAPIVLTLTYASTASHWNLILEHIYSIKYESLHSF